LVECDRPPALPLPVSLVFASSLFFELLASSGIPTARRPAPDALELRSNAWLSPRASRLALLGLGRSLFRLFSAQEVPGGATAANARFAAGDGTQSLPKSSNGSSLTRLTALPLPLIIGRGTAPRNPESSSRSSEMSMISG